MHSHVQSLTSFKAYMKSHIFWVCVGLNARKMGIQQQFAYVMSPLLQLPILVSHHHSNIAKQYRYKVHQLALSSQHKRDTQSVPCAVCD